MATDETVQCPRREIIGAGLQAFPAVVEKCLEYRKINGEVYTVRERPRYSSGHQETRGRDNIQPVPLL